MQAGQPARRAVHMGFVGEKVHTDYAEPVPELGTVTVIQGVRLVPIEHLIRMKLTSYRLKDQMHLKDLDEAGAIQPGIEDALPDVLRERLCQIRAAV